MWAEVDRQSWPAQVLPLTEEKKTQKVAAGDLSGVVQCFSVKKGEFNVAFKTLPSAANKASTGRVHGWGSVGQEREVVVGCGREGQAPTAEAGMCVPAGAGLTCMCTCA